MATVNEIKIKISILLDEAKAKLNELRNGLGNLGNQSNAGHIKTELDGVGKSATGLKNTLDRVGGDIKGTIAGMFAVGAVIAFAHKLVETTRVIQDLHIRLSGLTKGNQDLASSEAYLTDLAHRHHKSVEQLTDSYSKLLIMEQAGVITRQQSKQLLEGFSNVMSSTGASSAQVGQALYGMSQALSQGTVQSAEFNQIIEPLPGLGNRIAKAFGEESVGALRKLIGEGKITSEMLGVNMVQALKAYEGAAERSAGTITASYADVNTAYVEMVKESEKPIASATLKVVDVGKETYGWLKDNGNTIITLLTGIAVVMAGKVASALSIKTQAGIQAIQVEQAHTAAITENAQREELARAAKVRAAEAKMLDRTATAELAASTLALTDVEISLAQAESLVTGSTTHLASAQTARAVAQARLTAATESQAAANQFLLRQQAKLLEAQLAATTAANASGVAMTRLGAAFKSAFAFVGGWVGVAVIALWGLYEVLNKVTDAEEKAEIKAKAFQDSLTLMNTEVKKLSAEQVDIDFSKTEQNIESVKAKIKELEEFKFDKLLNLGDISAQRENLKQQLEVLDQRKEALATQKNNKIGDFDASTLSAEQLNSELAKTQAEIKTISDRLAPLQQQVKDGLLGADAVNADLLLLDAYKSKLSAIEGATKTANKTDKVDPKIAEAQAKSEEKTIASAFKLKEQMAKNAYEVAIAEAGKDAAKKLQIDKDYNEQSLQLTLQRLEAEKAAKIKTNELSGKKTKGPELEAELANIENERLAAINEAETKRKTIGFEQRDNAKELAEKQQEARFDLEKSKIDLALERNKAETKLAIDELKRLKEQGALGGQSSGKFDADIKKASQKHGFDYDAVQAQFEKSAAAHGVPADLLRAQVKQESHFNPRIGSSAGAYGFSQFIAGTAKHYGLTDRSDPIASIEAQAKMMGEKIRQYDGRLDLALAAYNGGDGGANYLQRNPQYMKSPDYNAPASAWKHQTGDYVKKIMGDYGGDTKASGSSEVQLIEQTQASTQHYYDEKIKAENKGIEASITAVKEKLALAEKEYSAKKATASPEELPKLEADYLANTAQLKQQLEQLNAELIATQQQNNAELAKELNAAKQEQIDIEEKAALDRLQLAETEAQQQLELGAISKQQFLEKQQAFEDQRYQIALKGVQDRRALLDDGDGVGQAKSLAKEKELNQGHAKAIKEINHKSALDSKASFTSAFAPIKSAFSSTVSGIIQGTTTVKEGMRNMAQSMVLSFANAMTNMAVDAAAQWAWELLGFGAKETTKATLKTSSEAAQTAATVGGIATRQTAETGAHSIGMATMLGSALSTIGTKAAEAAASTYASVSAIPYVGWLLAPPAAAATFIAVMGYQSMVSMFSSAGGEWDVPNDRVNLVHKRETILPAHIAQPMREFFSNGGIGSYGLPQQAAAFNSQAATSQLSTTAMSALAMQQSFMQTQAAQQRKQSSGTVVINAKGGDWVHKDQLGNLLARENRNFRTVS